MEHLSDELEAPKIDAVLSDSTQDAITHDVKLQNATVRAALALDAGSMGSWQWDCLTGQVFGDPVFCQLFGFDPNKDHETEAVAHVNEALALIHPDDADRVSLALDKAIAGTSDYYAEFRVCRPGEEPQWIAGKGRVVERGSDGKPVRFLGVNWDLSEQKAQEERLAVLASEMDHRVKNAFAVIRALVTIGERTSSGMKDFAEVLRQQISAMAEAHAVTANLARERGTADISVPVKDIAEAALSPWLTGAKKATNIEVSTHFEDSVRITPQEASSLAMLLYELATNAVKYGPLGANGGKLDVRGVADEGGKDFLLTWRETVDQPAPEITKAAEKEAKRGKPAGFGSTLIKHCQGVLRAEVKRELTPTGLHFELRMKVTETEDDRSRVRSQSGTDE